MKTNNLFLFFAVCSALTGCGQPGPLYLPGTTPPVHVEPEPESKPEPKSEPISEKTNNHGLF